MTKTTVYRPCLRIPKELFDTEQAEVASKRLFLRHTAVENGAFVFVALTSPRVRLASPYLAVHDYATRDEVTAWGKEVCNKARIFYTVAHADKVTSAHWLEPRPSSHSAWRLMVCPEAWPEFGVALGHGALLFRELFDFYDAALSSIGLWVSLGVAVVNRKRGGNNTKPVEYVLLVPEGSPMQEQLRALDLTLGLFANVGHVTAPLIEAGDKKARLYRLIWYSGSKPLRTLDAAFGIEG